MYTRVKGRNILRDKRFVVQHRGGLLSEEHHRQLMAWALVCTEQLQNYTEISQNEILTHALEIGHQWAAGRVKTGAAMNASRAVHMYARTVENQIDVWYCRSVGQAVATAHMADHCLGPLWYGSKIIHALGFDWEAYKNWAMEQLRILAPSQQNLIVESLLSLPL